MFRVDALSKHAMAVPLSWRAKNIWNTLRARDGKVTWPDLEDAQAAEGCRPHLKKTPRGGPREAMKPRQPHAIAHVCHSVVRVGGSSKHHVKTRVCIIGGSKKFSVPSAPWDVELTLQTVRCAFRACFRSILFSIDCLHRRQP